MANKQADTLVERVAELERQVDQFRRLMVALGALTQDAAASLTADR